MLLLRVATILAIPAVFYSCEPRFFTNQTAIAYPEAPSVDYMPGKVCDENSKDFIEFRYAEQTPYCKQESK